MTLNKAIRELNNLWATIFFGDDNKVCIMRQGKVIDSTDLKDVNDDAEVVEFIMQFVNS